MAKPRFNKVRKSNTPTRSWLFSENGGNQPTAGEGISKGRVNLDERPRSNDVFEGPSTSQVELPRAAKRATKKATKVAKPRKRVRKTDSEKLFEGLQAEMFVLNNGMEQMLEVLEEYTKRHLVDTEPYVLRELLRALLRVMPDGMAKSKVRGILGYFTRTPVMKTWMKLAKVIHTIAKTAHKTTFVTEKLVPYDRVVDDTTILKINGNPRYQERITIMDAKIERLKLPKKQKPNRQVGSDSLPSMESIEQ